MARTQRELYNQKKQLARDKPDECRTYTVDYSQNVYMPHFGDEQPGETYYYSPVNAYVLGIVDCGRKPMRMTAHVYFENEGKKGGNNVTSLLRKQLFGDGFLAQDKKHVKEINFVFDNCGGQNKNRMVLRMLLHFVKRGICDVARATFLIKGHTKNDCDRMFNLMKQGYRKKNSYTPSDVLNNLKHPDVKAMKAHAFNFFDWDACKDVYMRRPEHVKKNHTFKCHANDPTNLHVREFHGAPEVIQQLVKRNWKNKDWFPLGTQPEQLQHPGMKDIKYKELYDKWRPLIPVEKRKEYKCYNDDPGDEMRGKVKKESKESKAARKNRSATNVEQVHKKNSEQPSKSPKQDSSTPSNRGII